MKKHTQLGFAGFALLIAAVIIAIIATIAYVAVIAPSMKKPLSLPPKGTMLPVANTSPTPSLRPQATPNANTLEDELNEIQIDTTDATFTELEASASAL